MRLTVLGSSGTYPARGNPASGYFVTVGSTRLMLDAGAGTYVALAEHVDPGALDAVVISHEHVDHCTDLFALMHRVLHGPRRPSPIPVYLPESARVRLAAFGGAGMAEAFTLVAVEGESAVSVGDVVVTFADAAHSVPALMTRIDAAGAALVYTGDTGPTPRLAELAAGSDLLVAEASLEAGDTWEHHMTPAQAGTAAADAGAARLLLTHLRPTVDVAGAVRQAAAVFGGSVSAATPGLVVDL